MKKEIRFEARYTGNKVPIKCFNDLDNLNDFNPFEKMKFIRFDSSKVETFGLSKKKLKYLHDFSADFQKKGFHYAKSRGDESSNRNFNRSILPVIKEGLKEINIYKIWKKRVFNKFYSQGKIK